MLSHIFPSLTYGCHTSKCMTCSGVHKAAIIALFGARPAMKDLHSPLGELQSCSAVLYAGICQMSLFYVLNIVRKK